MNENAQAQHVVEHHIEFLSGMTNIDEDNLRSGNITPAERRRLHGAQQAYAAELRGLRG